MIMVPRPTAHDESEIALGPIPDSTVRNVLKALLLNSNDGVAVTDASLGMLACNGMFGHYFAMDYRWAVSAPAEEVSNHVATLVDDYEAFRERVMRINSHPESTYEDRLELSFPYRRVLSRRSAPFRDQDGRIAGRIWTFRDITDLVRRQRFRELIHEVSLFNDPDPANVCKFIVETLAAHYESGAVLGLVRGDRILFRSHAGLPEDYCPANQLALNQAYDRVPLATRQPFIVEDAREAGEFWSNVPARHGLTRYLGTCVYNRENEAIGTLSVLDGRTDVAHDGIDVEFLTTLAMRLSVELQRETALEEKVQSQQVLIAQKEREIEATTQTLEAMNAVFRAVAGQGDIVSIVQDLTQAYRGVLGYDAHVVALRRSDGRWQAATTHADRRFEAEPIPSPVIVSELEFWAAYGDGGTEGHDLVHVGPCSSALASRMGTPFVTKIGVYDEGQPIGFALFGVQSARDWDDPHFRQHLEAITEQLVVLCNWAHLEERLREASLELEETQRRLVQSEKLSAVGTLAASIAHDIRNIVASLQLEISLGQGDPSTALVEVRRQLQRFAVLSHHLLSFTKPKLTTRTKVDLKELVDNVLGLTETQAKRFGVDVKVDIRPRRSKVHADPDQCEHLFMNLILNALQAMEHRGGELSIRTIAHGKSLVVEVSDTGPGIPPDRVDKLFEPFYSTRKGGFGLGLFSCKRIADEHGWRIEFSSQVGKGTTVQIWTAA
jgi:signal transduction histidine kinase